MPATSSTSTRLSIYREHIEDDELGPSRHQRRHGTEHPVRNWAARALLATLSAAGITAVCLAQGINGPFGPVPGWRNFAFWVLVGMGVGLVIRITLAGSAYVANSLRGRAVN